MNDTTRVLTEEEEEENPQDPFPMYLVARW
jgi:hypothetical protein